MIIKYLLYSITITLGSWTVGILFNGLFSKSKYYPNLSHLNFIKSETLNKRIGLETFKWIVKNSFFKYFNQKLNLKNKVKPTDLNELRREMTFAEIGHLVGFTVVSIFALLKFIHGNYIYGVIFMVVNVILNLYPSLLQQENKRRIDKLIMRYKK